MCYILGSCSGTNDENSRVSGLVIEIPILAVSTNFAVNCRGVQRYPGYAKCVTEILEGEIRKLGAGGQNLVS